MSGLELKREKFWTLFKAEWGRLPSTEKGVLQEWHDLVDQIPESQVKPLVDTMAELQGERQGLPRLSRARKALSDMKRTSRPTFTSQSDQDCAFCHGSGFMWCVDQIEGLGKPRLCASPETSSARLVVANVHCLCSKGRDYASRSQIAMSEEFRLKVKEWRVAFDAKARAQNKDPWFYLMELIQDAYARHEVLEAEKENDDG